MNMAAMTAQCSRSTRLEVAAIAPYKLTLRAKPSVLVLYREYGLSDLYEAALDAAARAGGTLKTIHTEKLDCPDCASERICLRLMSDADAMVVVHSTTRARGLEKDVRLANEMAAIAKALSRPILVARVDGEGGPRIESDQDGLSSAASHRRHFSQPSEFGSIVFEAFMKARHRCEESVRDVSVSEEGDVERFRRFIRRPLRYAHSLVKLTVCLDGDFGPATDLGVVIGVPSQSFDEAIVLHGLRVLDGGADGASLPSPSIDGIACGEAADQLEAKGMGPGTIFSALFRTGVEVSTSVSGGSREAGVSVTPMLVLQSLDDVLETDFARLVAGTAE